nr:pwwp domain-containing protein 3 [Quercus suber]
MHAHAYRCIAQSGVLDTAFWAYPLARKSRCSTRLKSYQYARWQSQNITSMLHCKHFRPERKPCRPGESGESWETSDRRNNTTPAPDWLSAAKNPSGHFHHACKEYQCFRRDVGHRTEHKKHLVLFSLDGLADIELHCPFTGRNDASQACTDLPALLQRRSTFQSISALFCLRPLTHTTRSPSIAQQPRRAPSLSLPATAVPEAQDTIASQANDEPVVTKEDVQLAGEQATSEVTAPDGASSEVAVPPSAVDADSASAAAKKEKRKSNVGVPEHKAKALKKKKSMPNLHLDCKPGDLYWARLKGYPPWPSIICDEQMLPEPLLLSRPVSTTRPDGSLRDDFKEGGKNAKERTFPIMFLYTNEFSWIVNTALTPLDPEECTVPPKTKMSKSLTAAYELAAERHDIQYFKDLLKQWEEDEKAIDEEMREIAEAQREKDEAAASKEAEKASEKKVEKKKKARKSKAADEDIEMDGAETPVSSRKRKKEAESDAENGKVSGVQFSGFDSMLISQQPKKTPKVTKLNVSKTPNGEASTKKSRKKVAKPDEDEVQQKPQMTEEERMTARENAALYLRHRLQKGFLTRDQAPLEGEMSAMADFFNQLENYENLEASILKKTKLHKVLKGIVKLSSIPKDDVYNFKKRSAAMLEIWNMRMDAAEMEVSNAVAENKPEVPETNGQTLVLEAGEPKVESDTNETTEQEVKTAEETADSIEKKVETSAAADEELSRPVDEASEKTAGAATSEANQEGDANIQTAPEVGVDGV